MASTNSPFAATGGMAFCQTALSFHQRQTWGRASIALRGSLPVAGVNQVQDWPELTRRAGFKLCAAPRTGRGLRGSCLRILNPTTLDGHPPPLAGQRAFLLPAHGGQLPVRAIIAAPGFFIRATRLQSAPAQSIPDQHRSQFGAAGVIHISNAFRRRSLAAPTNASKLGQGIGYPTRERGRSTQGAKPHD